MGILAALEWLVREFSKHTGVLCEFDAPRYKIHLDEGRSIALFRLVQESLTNVARHAKAQSVHVILVEKNDEYLLEVRDDGQGFDPSITKRKHFGLAGIRERGALIGGEVIIDSAPGNGTSIRVHIPIIEPMEYVS
jgi:signal transduction histidine kinase